MAKTRSLRPALTSADANLARMIARTQMKEEDKLIYIYQWVETRRKQMDDMTAPEYNKLDPATELRSVLVVMDDLDEGNPK